MKQVFYSQLPHRLPPSQAEFINAQNQPTNQGPGNVVTWRADGARVWLSANRVTWDNVTWQAKRINSSAVNKIILCGVVCFSLNGDPSISRSDYKWTEYNGELLWYHSFFNLSFKIIHDRAYQLQTGYQPVTSCYRA